jgi:hypothetical protein
MLRIIAHQSAIGLGVEVAVTPGEDIVLDVELMPELIKSTTLT